MRMFLLHDFRAILKTQFLTYRDLLYAQFLSTDGNFKLDSLSSATRRGHTPAFLKNGSHWVNEEKRAAYLATAPHKSEESDQVCSFLSIQIDPH